MWLVPGGGGRGRTAKGVAVCLAVGSLSAVTSAAATAGTVAFGKSVVSGISLTVPPSSLQFGPDGQLYVLQSDGIVMTYRVTRGGPNAYAATETANIGLVKDIVNHDDNGVLNTTLGRRQATGMAVTGTAAAPVIYVSSSDPRYGGGARGDLNLDTNSGIVSRLTWTGSAWEKLDLVRGLPRSEENHSINGIALDPASNTLYLAAGGNTNMGAPSGVFAQLPEYALSAAILKIDLGAIGNTTYDLPTLDDPAQPGADATDPFGGNDGANQAKLVPGGPVQIYAAGFRNPYDILRSSKGLLYTDDNGHNAGQGDVPIGEGPAGTCTNASHEPGVTGPDSLHLLSQGYYGGHPNPTRGNMANTFNGQSPVPSANPVECDYRLAGVDEPVLATDPSSSNGLAEYTASNFGGAMKGDLLQAAYDNYVTRVQLDSTGTQAVATSTLFSTVGVHPLDVVALGDSDPFPGTIWVADHGNSNIYVFEPNDYAGVVSTCTGANSTTLDEDGDGFTNADEIANGTDPCSAADKPHDWDGDHVSDLNDPDDDNDGIPDTSDPFAIDPANGMNTSLPLTYAFDNNTTNPGGLLDLGFTGLMTNGTTNYRDLYDPQQLTAGGAPGVLTVDALPAGDTTSNDAGYAFQFGVHVDNTTGPFAAHTRMVSPFAGTTPSGAQSMGLQLGTGTQDDYVKLVLTANGGAPGVQAVREVGGVVTAFPVTPLPLPGPATVDLFLQVDRATATAQPSMAVGTGARQNVGPAVPIPASWMDGHAGLAVGVVGSSAGGSPLPASWDMLEARAVTRPDATVKLAADATALGNNVYNTTGAGQTRAVTTARGTSKTLVVRVGNDGLTTDGFNVRGPGSAGGFTVKYLKGASGTTDVTAAVVAGTYHMSKVVPDRSAVLRLVVTVAAGTPPGTVGSWLVTAKSRRSTAVTDAVLARVTAS